MPNGWAKCTAFSAFRRPDSAGHATGGTAAQLQLRHHLRHQLGTGLRLPADNMAADISEVVQREFQYCVIDEVDSILIDEARTPLIISGQVERPQEKYEQAAQGFALERADEIGKDGIDPEGDYEVDEQRSCTLTDEGFAKAEQMLDVQDLFDPQDPWAHYITNALKAKELFVKDVNYIVRDGEAVIVDEFTGRVMPGRRWSDGQHQAIEAKEALQIQATQTLA